MVEAVLKLFRERLALIGNKEPEYYIKNLRYFEESTTQKKEKEIIDITSSVEEEKKSSTIVSKRPRTAKTIYEPSFQTSISRMREETTRHKTQIPAEFSKS